MSGKRDMMMLMADEFFREPRDRTDADRRLADLKLNIFRGEALLRDPELHHPVTRVPLTQVERINVKTRLEALLDHMREEVAYIEMWVTLKGGKPIDAAGVDPDTMHQLLWRCLEQMRRFKALGVPFSSSDQTTLTDVASVLSLRAEALLREARDCTGKGPENAIQFRSLVAQAVQSEEDIAAIAKVWKKLGEYEKLDPFILSLCGLAYVQALLALGRAEEAVAIVSSLDLRQRYTLYAWIEIVGHTDDPAALEMVRDLGRKLEYGHREWFFLRMYELMGHLEDADLATSPKPLPSSYGRSQGWHSVSLLRAHIAHGRLVQAREAFLRIHGVENKMHALACIAGSSREPEDLRLLVASTVNYCPVTVLALKEVIATLARHGHVDVALAMLEKMSTWHLKCAGLAVIAEHVSERAAEMLNRAQDLMAGAHKWHSPEEAEALFLLVRAQATRDRVPEAMRTAKAIKDPKLRCRAFLLLHAVTHDQPIPAVVNGLF